MDQTPHPCQPAAAYVAAILTCMKACRDAAQKRSSASMKYHQQNLYFSVKG